MNATSSVQDRAIALSAAYGDGADGATPTSTQWQRLLDRPADQPVTLLNLFKIRDQAAFDRYAEVSIPAMQKAGGTFLMIAPCAGAFLGEDEDWDLVAIGRYPDAAALLRLLDDPDYQAAFPHRTAACARQKVLICDN